jgi:hypothetical protein
MARRKIRLPRRRYCREVLVDDKLAEGLSGAEAGVQLLGAVFSLD